MKHYLLILVCLMLTINVAAQSDDMEKSFVRAPEFTGAKGWLNVEKPL
ncbi:MAG: hypothetical protein H7Z37_07735, partial [Pyrinomonadaceae bacterium]|nr:hypothetical protein [Pyrinomonadaceae bacterium]